MTTNITLRQFNAGLCLLVSLLLGWFGTDKASAFTAADRDACWSAWTNSFYYVTGDGRGHFRNREGGTSPMSFWQEAEEIEIFCDATNVANQITLVNQVCAGFTNQFGMNWSGNTFNDDLMWSSMAFSRAYQLTGNTTYRTLAKNGFDVAYIRGLDPSDGGIFQTTGNTNPKCTCGNGSGACAAYLLYQTLNDVSYKTKAQGIYGWMVTNVFDAATGAVMEGPGTGNYFTYDSGCFASIAYWLGNTNYANKAGDWVTNHWGVAMQSFGPGSDGGGMNGICLRGLARTGHNIVFLQAACDNAWSWRNVRGLTATDWNGRTSDALATLYSYDTCSHVAGMLCVPPGAPVTVPVTAADVVGSQITFTTTAFGGTNLTYQWQVIQLGATNNIPGATNFALTLSNLQLTNTASYQLRGSNTSGIVTSTLGSLTVSTVSVAVTNVITSYAAQTGQGYGFAYTPTWQLTTNGNVIVGQYPSGTNGNYDLEPSWGDRNVGSMNIGDSLTITPGGSPTTISTNYVTCGNGSSAGSSIVYTLTNSSARGYSLTNITVYGGWRDAGRDQQAYTVYYSQVTAPATFLLLASVNYNPANAASVPLATRASLTPLAGVLATNVAAVKFDFTTPASENGYCGYSEITMYGTPCSPTVTTNTLPATAADVVGSQVTFNASFIAANPLAYQWLKVSGGVTNPIIGATNSTLTLTNLQLTDTASYQLQASNANGVAVSSLSSLKISNVPAPVSGIITSFAAQTGLGSAATNFVPTWSIPNNNWLVGAALTAGPGDFGLNQAGGNPSILTDGSYGYVNYWPGVGSSPTEVTCGISPAGQSLAYRLPFLPLAGTSGFDLSNIIVYGGWGDAGRDEQKFEVLYSTEAAPTEFIHLADVDYNPSNPSQAQSATRVTLSPATKPWLAQSVYAIQFNFNLSIAPPKNGYEGYSEIVVSGRPSPIAPPTLPATAIDIVGSQVTFSAAFLALYVNTYQWQVIRSGSTTDMPGETNATLTLTNLHLTDTAAYQLQVSNSIFGIFASTPSSLTVSNLPLAVNNIVTAIAAQTGSGSGTFTPTWIISTNHSLIAGQSPSTALGNFSLEATGRSVDSLTAGGDESITSIFADQTFSGHTADTNYVTCGWTGAGTSITYPLTGSTYGYNLTNIMVCGGWIDAGRDQQAYSVYYSTVDSPATFNLLGNVNFNPANVASVQSATRITLTPATGALATNVAAVMFDFTNPRAENGYCGYSQIALFGTPSPLIVANPANITVRVMANTIQLSWPSDHTGWRLQVQTNDLTQGLGTNWVDVAGATATNQMIIPISPDNSSVFYRLAN